MPGRSWKLLNYTEKELETAWAAPELLGVPTIGGGSARSRGGGGEGHGSQISLPSRPKCTKKVKKQAVLLTFWQIICRKRHFRSKVLNKIYSRDVFWGIHEFWNSLLKPLQSYSSSKFRKLYTPPAARIRVKSQPSSASSRLHVFQPIGK